MIKSKQNPKVSVIIPTYNRGYILSRAINSVLKQTFKDFELLVIDDGSTDNTKYVVKNFQTKDSRIKYFSYSPNKGGNTAHNLGVRRAKGEYLAFLDSDDEWFYQNLEKRVNLFDKLSNKYGLVYCQAIKKILNFEEVLPKRGINGKESVIEYLFENKGHLLTSTLIIRTATIKENNIYFDESLLRHRDWDFAIEFRKYTNFYFLKEPLTVWHVEDIYSKLNEKFKLDFSLRFIKKNIEEFVKHPKSLANFQWNLATKCLRSGQIKQGRQILKKSNQNKSQIKKNILYFYSFLGTNFIYLIFELYYIYRKAKNKF